MTNATRVPADACRKLVDPDSLRFESTEDLAPLSGIGSQERALSALAFGLDIQQARFHVVVVGAPGTGRTFSARSMAKRIAATRPTPDDLLLLPNPSRPSEPTVLYLPPGEGNAFVGAMEDLYTKLMQGLQTATEGERFRQSRSKIQRRVNAEQARLEAELKEQAEQLGLDLVRTDDEVQITPLDDEKGTPSPEALAAISEHLESFEDELAKVHDEADNELRTMMKQLLMETAKQCFAPALERYEEREDVVHFLSEVQTAVTRELRLLVEDPGSEERPSIRRGLVIPTLLTEHEPQSGAPVVEVPYPTLTGLFGRSHSPVDSAFPPEPGFAVAGALHQANGGFLILPAAALLKNEVLYEQLKACLLAERFIVPEHNPSYYRGSAEELLLPAIPIDVKVILIAGPFLYQELHDADPEFSQLFKVQARFEPLLPLGEALRTYPAFLSGISHDRHLPPFTASAVAELLFFGGRLAEDQTKVTARLGVVAEIGTEAAYRAQKRGRKETSGTDVLEALEEQRRRGGHFRDQLAELLRDNTIRIEVAGERVGQVNAISVLSDGPQTFGRPCRVTAVVYPGLDGPMNIAREVEMSGPIHSKGVLTLTGFLASRFAQRKPLSFSASLVFEQTYEAIDGDSASSSELYALLSALSGIPIKQSLAVTGAVDQRGSVLAVGGLNEKIEAFYDLCVTKGLDGTQGVLIPPANKQALMLRPHVIEAIREERFHIYEVPTVEAGIELLTGVPAGKPNDRGQYEEGSVFRSVADRLGTFLDAVKELGR